MRTMVCEVNKNIATDDSFAGWSASSQWACADTVKGVLLSPVSLLLHLWGNGSIFITITLLRKCEAGGGREEWKQSFLGDGLCRILLYSRLTAVKAEPEHKIKVDQVSD